MSTERSPFLSQTSSSNTPQFSITVYDSQLSNPGKSTDFGPPYFRSSPLQLLRYDLFLLLRYAREIINIFRPWPAWGSDIGTLGILAQIAFVIVSLIITAALGISFFVGVPIPPVLSLGAVVVAVWVMSRLQGDIKMGEEEKDAFEDEAWLFVNGIATSASGLQLILDRLHEIFGRRVTGIHNKTFGIWWDLVECMLQRDLLWGTMDVRVGYQTICKHIRDPKKKKVVLLAHSQGGIIMSTWVDQLLSDFPSDALRKIEIYTFAAAANHFSVPSAAVYSEHPQADQARAAADDNAGNTESDGQEGSGSRSGSEAIKAEATGTGSRQIGRRFVFGIVEHFVNTRDYVSLIGLLEFAPPPPKNTPTGVCPPNAAEGRFAGRIFRREGHTGHLLLAHYLKKGDSILDHPTTQKYSQLVRYMHGQRAEVEDRYWKDTEVTEITQGEVADGKGGNGEE